MLKIKDKVLGVEQYVLELENKLKETEEDGENIFNMGGDGSAEMLLRSMLQSSIIGSNSNDDGRLNIHETDEDSNDFGDDVSEIKLTETELNKLKDEVICDLQEENINTDEIDNSKKIDVSENEEEVEREE